MTISCNKILILSDGVPGHVNQARGLASWIAATRDCTIEEVETRLKHKFLRPLYRALLNTRSPLASRIILAGYQQVPAKVTAGTLLLSCGGNTSFINAALRRQWGNPGVFIGSLRRLKPTCFTAVMTIEPVAGASNNIVMDFAPSYIDQDGIADAGSAFLAEKQPARPLWVMLLGGNGAGYTYDTHDWETLAQNMRALAQTHQIQWLVTSSRRTDQSAESCIESRLGEYLFDSLWFSRHGSQSLKGFLGAAERVFCTEDSMTMLSESINAGKPVVSLRPRQAAPNQRFLDAVVRFEKNAFLARSSIEQAHTLPPAVNVSTRLIASRQRVLAQLQSLLDHQGRDD